MNKLTGGITHETESASGIHLENLDIEDVLRYGVYFGISEPQPKGITLRIDNVDVDCLDIEHPYRIYAHDVIVENSSGTGSNKTSFWMVEGDDSILRQHDSDLWLRVGPNHICSDGGNDRGQRVRGALIENIVGPRVPTYIQIEPGTLGCYLNGVTTQNADNKGLRIGRGPGTNTTYRPWNRIRWDGLDPNTTVDFGHISGCEGPNIGKCAGDANFNQVVNIDDLLVVIGGWGGCAALGTCCYNSVCHRDITQATCQSVSGTWHARTGQQPYDDSFEVCQAAQVCVIAASCNQSCFLPPDTCPGDVWPPQRGDRTVGIDDLLQVIERWGCNAAGNPPPDYPETIDACFDTYCEGLEGEEWQECIEKCILAVCDRYPEQCD